MNRPASLLHQSGDERHPTVEDFELLALALSTPSDACLCHGSEPDEFGQRDHIVNPDCPLCGRPEEA